MSYYLAPCLVALRAEIDARWPDRDKASDGWIGDTSHAARPSDHNPDWANGGVVRAIDVDKDGIDVDALLKTVIGDSRVWYVIFDRAIYSRTYGWEKRPYTGSNPHDKHVHVSISRGQEKDTGPWFAPVKAVKVQRTRGPEVDKMLRLGRRAKSKVRNPEGKRARMIQRALNHLRRIPGTTKEK